MQSAASLRDGKCRVGLLGKVKSLSRSSVTKQHINNSRSPAPLNTIMNIPELEHTLRNDRTYAEDKRRGAIGLLVNRLDKLAGDKLRRRTFLKAYFNVESSHDLSDSQIAGLLAWVEHPRAQNAVNLVIAEYLKAQGQMELI